MANHGPQQRNGEQRRKKQLHLFAADLLHFMIRLALFSGFRFGLITKLTDLIQDVLFRNHSFIVFDSSCFKGQVHICPGNAGHPVQAFFYPVCTRGTGHAGYIEFRFFLNHSVPQVMDFLFHFLHFNLSGIINDGCFL